MKKLAKSFLMIALVLTISLGTLCGCGLVTFEERCKTTEDGFVYFVSRTLGVCIIELPDSEELEIPEFIDGMPVMQLGYWEPFLPYGGKWHRVDGDHVKKLTIQHNPHFEDATFSNLETLIYKDILFVESNPDKETLKIFAPSGKSTIWPYNIELTKSDRQLDISNFKPTTIEIPKRVTKIEAEVFAGLQGVTIKTSYESKPDGWEDGWNGDCEVIWGEEIYISGFLM